MNIGKLEFGMKPNGFPFYIVLRKNKEDVLKYDGRCCCKGIRIANCTIGTKCEICNEIIYHKKTNVK